MAGTAMGLWWGPGAHYGAGNMGVRDTFLCNGSNDWTGIVMMCDRSGDIDQAEFYWTAVLDFGTAVTWNVRIEGVDANGDPDGAAKGGCSTEVLTLGVDILASNTSSAVTFSTPATVSQGDLIALVIWPTGAPAPNVINNFTVEQGRELYGGFETFAFPYTVQSTDTGVTWAHGSMAVTMGIRYDDGSWLTPVIGDTPTLITSQVAFNSGDAPNEYGGRFQVPYAMTVVGVRFPMRFYGTIHPTVKLYDAASLELASVDIYNTPTGATNRMCYAMFGEVDLSADVNYFIGLFNNDGVTDISEAWKWTFQQDNQRGGWPFMDGLRWAHVSRTGAGAWSVDTGALPAMALCVQAMGA